MNKDEIIGYIKTFLITMFIILVVIVLMIIYAKIQASKPLSKKQVEEYKSDQIVMLIDNYKYREKLEPSNFDINLKLGLIYEKLGQSKNAEQEYLKAVAKAPYGSFESKFELATLYIKIGKLETAANIVSGIKEYANQELIRSKAIFYEKLGQAYYAKKDYESAKNNLLNALYYQEKTPLKSTDVKKDLPKVYIKLSENYAKNGNKAHSISIIRRGIETTNSIELMYKLAQLVAKDNPREALGLLEKVSRLNPYIVNFEFYKSVLSDLANQAKNEDDNTRYIIYSEKYKRISRFQSANIIKPADVATEINGSGYTPLPFGVGSHLELNFKIKNKTEKNFYKLFVVVKIYDNKELVSTTEKRVAFQTMPIKAGEVSKNIHVKVTYKDPKTQSDSRDVTAAIYVKKNQRVPEVYVDTTVIPKIEQ